MILLTGRTQISPLPFQVSHIKFILPGSGILCRSHDPDVSTVAVLWVFYCTMMPFWLILKEEKSTSSDTTSAVDVSCWPGRILNFPPQEWQNSSGTTELQDAYYSRWLQTVLPVLSNSSVRRTDHTNRLTKIQNTVKWVLCSYFHMKKWDSEDLDELRLLNRVQSKAEAWNLIPNASSYIQDYSSFCVACSTEAAFLLPSYL